MGREMALGFTEYLKASFPCVFVRTADAETTTEEIRTIGDSLRGCQESENNGDVSWEMGVWRVTTGLMVSPLDGSRPPVPKADTITEALDYLQDNWENPLKPMIIGVFHHIRQYIENPTVIQKIIDTIENCRVKGSSLILVGSDISLPPELENIIPIIDWPLPSKVDLINRFEGILKSLDFDLGNREVKERVSKAAEAALGMDFISAENALVVSLVNFDDIDIEVIQRQKEDRIKQSDVLEYIPPSEDLGSVGGMDELKRWLRIRKKAFSDEARAFGLPYPKGILIVGHPGAGKSLAAKATAAFLGLPLVRMDLGRVFRSLVGESEAAIRQALSVAEAVSPCIIWIDEIEKALAGSKGSGELDSGVAARVVSTILTWRQETTKPVMLVATANDVNSLPSMVTRQGRFDSIWFAGLPYKDERKEIFSIHIKKRGRNPDNFSIEKFAAATEGFSGAEIEGAVVSAMYDAFAAGSDLKDTFLARAVKDIIPHSRRNPEEFEESVRWAESRARLVSSPPSADSPKKKSANIRTIR